MNKKKYHCLACEIARNNKVIRERSCICLQKDFQETVLKKFPYALKEVTFFNNLMMNYTQETKDILVHEILQKTIDKANRYENYQKAIDEVSVILRVIIEMRGSQKTVIDQAATEAGEKFLEIVNKVQSDSFKHIDIEKYAKPGDITIPGGPILGQPTITVSRPKLTL